VAAPLCTAHPGAPARAECTSCKRFLCTSCVGLALEGDDEHCSFCNAVATRLPPATSAPAHEPAWDPHVVGAPHVAPQIPTAAVLPAGAASLPDPSPTARLLSYVFSGSTLLVLFGLALVTVVLQWCGFLGWVIAAGLLCSYYFHIVVDCGRGNEHLEAPEFSDAFDSLLGPLLRYIAVLVPLVSAMCWYGVVRARDWKTGVSTIVISPHEILRYPGPALAFLLALALWPLMTAIAAISGSAFTAYNPVTWFKSLRLFGMRYVAGAFVFYALLVAESYVLPELTGLRSIPYAGVLVLQMIAIIALAMRACVLGLVCEPYLRR
jgi:hypothetical protein